MGLDVQSITLAGPSEEGIVRHTQNNDEGLGYEMSWLPPRAYNKPVDIRSYGDGTVVIVYAEETVGVLTEPPQNTAAFPQLHVIVRVGADQIMKQGEVSS